MMKKVIIVCVATLVSVKIIAQTASPNLINGVFIINKNTYYNASIMKTEYGAAAYFTYTPSLAIPTTAFDNAGNVNFNNKSLEYDNTKKFYSEGKVDDFTEQHWKVSGHNTIPNMNFIYNGTLPSFNVSETMVKDTLKKSDSLFVIINNVQHADSIRITISDNNLATTPHYIVLQAPNYANKYYLTPAMFNPLLVGDNSVIKVEAISYNYQTVAGKKYLFKNSFSFVKAGVTIINGSITNSVGN